MIIWVVKVFDVQFFWVCFATSSQYLLLLLGLYHFCPFCAHICMKCPLGISNFLEEISRLSHSIASISSYWLLRKATHFASRPILFNVAQLLCQYISTGEIWEEYIRLVIVIPLVGVGCREVKRWKMWTATSYFNKSKERVGLWMNFSFWRSLVLLWKKH